MITTVAELGVPYVCMHWRGHSADMQSRAAYVDVVSEVVAELAEQIEQLPDGGVAGRSADHRPRHRVRQDRRAQLGAAAGGSTSSSALGLPILVGVSRKAFLGHLLGTEERPRPARERDDASVAFTALLAAESVWGVRAHTVRAHRDAVAVAQRLIRGRRDQPLTVGRRAFGGRIGSGVRR